MLIKKKVEPISIDAQDKRRLGRNIAIGRACADLTQEEAGVAVGRNKDWWGNIERGRTTLSAIDLIRVSRLLNEPPENLVEMDYQKMIDEAS